MQFDVQTPGGKRKLNSDVLKEMSILPCSVPVKRCPSNRQGTNKILKLYMSRVNCEKQINVRSIAIKSKIYGEVGTWSK